MTLKSDPGNFFEDFVVGDELIPMSCEPPCMMEPQAVSVTSAEKAMSRFIPIAWERSIGIQYISCQTDEPAL